MRYRTGWLRYGDRRGLLNDNDLRLLLELLVARGVDETREVGISAEEYWRNEITCATFNAFDRGVEGEVSTDGSQVWIVKAQTRHSIFTFEANDIFEWPSVGSLGQVRDNMDHMNHKNLAVGLSAGSRLSHRVAGWSHYGCYLGGR